MAQAPTVPYLDVMETGPARTPRMPPTAGDAAGETRRRDGGGDDVPGPGSPGPRAARRGARRRRSAQRPEALRRLVPRALVVAFLAGGTSAFVADDKVVRLTVDGVPRTMHTFADDVRELLDEEGLDLRAHDVVAPDAGAALDSGDEITVRYGRPLTLTLDGRRIRVWTTARTVEGALREYGVRAEGAYLSVPRSTPIPRTGLTMDVRTERAVTFMADGHERTIRTNAATVREALAEAGIELRGRDTTSVAFAGFPRDGQTVTVMRISDGRQVQEEPIAFDVVRTRDPALFAGTEIVVRQGEPGVRRVTYALRTVNGVRQKPRRVGEEVVREPVAEQVRTGTRQLPSSVRGADGLNWSALAACESGGRPGAVDPSGTYGGLYQLDTATWRSLGGSGRPQDAPAEEQTYRAKKLYVQRGASPWPHCGRRLYR
ncbi:resuscitation-promoting factor [Streptomyces peucetius]|uniref:Ubiquitin-like domain-containing protein n=1 Tax=Streptomyces peucetius TaxID=1950 RepID=A0ABY6IHN4_STRPE|nr:resuscitation-promoting factor [Streptomyces peucetius]UYQ66522.1 ubiquitin-like domain-containing protein [Streptomyces peucetius]